MGNYATDYGGGIYSSGNLSINNCTIANNTGRIVAGGGVFGGGISSSGTLTMTNTTVSGNSAYVAGGILNIWSRDADQLHHLRQPRQPSREAFIMGAR